MVNTDSYLHDLFASEVSYVASPSDRDWDVMTAWITRLHEAGVEVMFDPDIPEIRQKVLQALWDQDEARRVQESENIQRLASDKSASATQAKQDIQSHQKIIADLMARDCIWWGD
jgi:hypothetical protein